MPCPVGFVLLTHNKPMQVVRLIKTLNRMFDAPQIVCHHDFSQSNIPTELFRANVSFVRPNIPTGWSKFSTVEATMLALKILFEAENAPDWFVLLSGADYPIKPARKIFDDLVQSNFDAHIHHEKITYKKFERDWQEQCFDRYCTIKFKIPSISRKLRPIKRTITLRHPFFTTPILPFCKSLACFAGEHWFCANRKAGQYLLEYHTQHPALAAHYRRLDEYTITPEESFYQTILCNNRDLRLSQEHWRYIDWSGGGDHPKTLSLEDWPELKKSAAHFARKFDLDLDAEILDECDRLIFG